MNSDLIKYIIYKAVNIFAVKIQTRKLAPLLRATHSFGDGENSFYFDLTDATTHFGDRLFFIPLLQTLINSGRDVRINSNDDSTQLLLKVLTGISVKTSEFPKLGDIIVSPLPSYCNSKYRHSKLLLVDFTDLSVSQKISSELVSSFMYCFGHLRFSTAFRILDDNSSSNRVFSKNNEKYYLFSNYIDSGSFRKYFIKETKLFSKAYNLKKQGYKIIHVGTRQDRINDKKFYSFVDLDLRGLTSITDLIQIVQSESVIGAITYDNFLMHLLGMYGKIAYVLFRGRFTRKNREHHMLHVNNTFFDQKDKLIYL